MLHYSYHLTVQSDLVIQADCYGPGDHTPDRLNGRVDSNWLEAVQGYLPLLDAKVEPGRKITEKVGELLYKTLFSGKIAGHFENLVWRKVQANQTKSFVTLTLAFQDGVPPNLVALPWEFLYEPESQAFLATHVNVAFAYRRAEWPFASAWGFNENLRILLVRMQPEGLSTVALAQLKNYLNEKVDEHAALVPPVTLDNPDLAELEKALMECRPHILHFLAHGHVDDSGSRFALVSEDGKSERWFGDKSLAEVVSAYAPQLVVLQSCEGGRLSDVRSFANGAAWLVRHQIPAVLAMRYPVTNRTGMIFSLKMYERLLAGSMVDRAVQQGRRALAFGDPNATDSHVNRDFAAPMLWLYPKQEENVMNATIQIAVPGEELYEADVPLDLPVGVLLRQFAEVWKPASAGPAKRFVLSRKQVKGPRLSPSITLREAGVTSMEKLFFFAEPLEPTTPVGLTIEDLAGQHYTTAVLLSTPLRQLVDAFLAQQPGTGEPVAELVEAGNRSLPLDKTLFDAGVNDNSTLRIYYSPTVEGK